MPYAVRHYQPWALIHYGNWHNQVDCDTLEAFKKYSGYGFKAMEADEMDSMKSAFQTDFAYLKDNIVVHRLDSYSQFMIRYMDDSLEEGHTVSILGFLSTSLVESLIINSDEFRGYDMKLTLYVPEGTRCLYTTFINHIYNEQEMLFNVGQKIKILKKTKERGMTNIVGIALPRE